MVKSRAWREGRTGIHHIFANGNEGVNLLRSAADPTVRDCDYSYFLSEPGEDITPANGSGAGDERVIVSNWPPALPDPLAPSKRPVPSSISKVAVLSKRPGVA